PVAPARAGPPHGAARAAGSTRSGGDAEGGAARLGAAGPGGGERAGPLVAADAPPVSEDARARPGAPRVTTSRPRARSPAPGSGGGEDDRATLSAVAAGEHHRPRVRSEAAQQALGHVHHAER